MVSWTGNNAGGSVEATHRDAGLTLADAHPAFPAVEVGSGRSAAAALSAARQAGAPAASAQLLAAGEVQAEQSTGDREHNIYSERYNGRIFVN